jgi:hypothetical protein
METFYKPGTYKTNFAGSGPLPRGPKSRKQITNKVNGAEKTKRVSKRATVMQARKSTVDLAALGSEERRNR